MSDETAPSERNEIVQFLTAEAQAMLNHAAAILVDQPQSGQAMPVLTQAGVVMSMAIKVARGYHMPPESSDVAEG